MSRALILMYHAIDLPRSIAEARFCVTPEAFQKQMTEVLKMGLKPIALATLVECMRAHRPIPPDCVAVTVDDGFECFQRNALPVLQDLRIPTTLFVVAGLIGSTNRWMQAKGWPARKLMHATELRAVQAADVTIGCHGMSHVPMTNCSDAELAAETLGARQILCDSIGTEINLFAYPHGAQGVRERRAVAAAGFSAACSTESGFNRHGADLYALRRLDIYGSDSVRSFRRKISFGANRVTYGDLARYYARQINSKFHA